MSWEAQFYESGAQPKFLEVLVPTYLRSVFNLVIRSTYFIVAQI